MKSTRHINTSLKNILTMSLFAILVTGFSLRAETIYSESFDYGDTTFDLSSNTGWSDGTSSLQYDHDGGLTYSSLNNVTGGSMFRSFSSSVSTTDSSVNYNLGALEVGSVVWYSALFDFTSDKSAYLQFIASNVSSVYFEIGSSGSITLDLAKSGAVSGSGGANRATGESVSNGTNLLLLKATKGGPKASPTNSEFEFWLNPGDISSESALGAADFSVSDGLWGRDTQVLSSIKASLPDGGRLDEIRIATTFNDLIGVIPEPSTFVLAGLGLMSVCFQRRKK